MRITPVLRTAALAAIVSVGLIGQAVFADAAGAVTAVKSELKNGALRLEGHSSPGVWVIATSTTSIAGIRADSSGSYRIEASDFTAPDCKVTISDSLTPTATVTFPDCTPSVTPVPTTPEPPTGGCAIVPQPPVTVAAGLSTAVNFDTTGCNTTFDSGATPTPVQWTVVAGSIPTGMTGPISQGTTGGNIIGTPSSPGTYQFTLQVTDQVGAVDQENLTVTVE